LRRLAERPAGVSLLKVSDHIAREGRRRAAISGTVRRIPGERARGPIAIGAAGGRHGNAIAKRTHVILKGGWRPRQCHAHRETRLALSDFMV
jgi:hypothetical protein